MRACMFTFAVCALLAAVPAFAHGPQIQTTLAAGKIVTRKIVDDESYATELTAPTSAYVMPLGQFAGIWRAQPDNSLVGWPGFAYGYGYEASTNPAPFPLGSKFILGFTAGLKLWDGTVFIDAGATEAEAYRGSSATPSAIARTSDAGPFQGLMFPSGSGISFASEKAGTHNTVNYQMLGDGTSTTSPLNDGIYLLSLQLSSTDATVGASDPFYFVLDKNSAPGASAAAVETLGFAPEAVQVVPEPAAHMLAAIGAAGFVGRRLRGCRNRR